MSNVVDFEKLKDAQYAFSAKRRCKEAREPLRAHGGATTIDSIPEQNWDALFGALAKAGCAMTERVTRTAAAEVNDDEESRLDNITAQLTTSRRNLTPNAKRTLPRRASGHRQRA